MRNWTEERLLNYCAGKRWRVERIRVTEYKKYDSADNYIQHNARLTHDAEVREFDGRQLVKLKFVSEARGKTKEGEDRYETIWIEALVNDFDAPKAAFLEKGDVLTIEGKPALRMWGDEGDKVSFELVRARLHMPISLFTELKERGFEPGEVAESKKRTLKGSAKKAAPVRKAKGKVVEIADDEEDADE